MALVQPSKRVKRNIVSLEKYALSRPDPMQNVSGRQELCENIVNELIMNFSPAD
jgi:predicted transcriptional regulator